MSRPAPSFNSATEQSNQTEVLALLNQHTRTDAMRTLAPRDYRGGQLERVKLWVGPETIGAELLKTLNRDSDNRIDAMAGDLSRETLNKHKTQAHNKNRDRAETFVRATAGGVA